jgi:hypothetical protein
VCPQVDDSKETSSDDESGKEGGSGSGAVSVLEDPKARWNSTMAVRTIHAIVATKKDFLNSERTMSSDQIDAGKHKAYWEGLADFCRNPANESVLSQVLLLWY